jgi:HK97 family phage portal protein
MKQRALDVGIGTVARDLALVDWKTFTNGKFKRDSLYYHLNTQPNVNQNAADFWEEVVRKLFYEETEVLIVVTSDDQFIVADNFNVKKYVLKENIYTDIQKDGFTFNRTFIESEVIHLNYQNLKLKTIVRELDDSYGQLFNRLVQVSMRTNQIRGTAKLTGHLAKDKDAQSHLQTFVDKIFDSFRTKSEAIIPIQDGMEYEEVSREANTRSQIDELNKVSDEYLNSVLEAIGIHPAIVSGDMAEVSQHQDKYLLNVIQPLVEQITDEINRKFFTPEEFLNGSRLNPSVVKLRYISIFDMGSQSEKLVGSSTFTPNEVREAAGYDRIEDPLMDKYYMTRNIVPIEGGDDDKQEASEIND